MMKTQPQNLQTLITSHGVTEQAFRKALGRFPTGVTIVTAQTPGQPPVGLTVSSFNSVSLEPPLILWSLSCRSSSSCVFTESEHYVIHVLSSEQFDLAKRFSQGTQSSRFEGLPVTQTPSGVLRLDLEFAAWFECRNVQHLQQGDHLLFLGEVQHCAHSDELPLIYHAGGYDLTPAGQTFDCE
ncbi:flavin reductase family protein [Orrella sp. 11846]|uniref:flavin reductase family protein n=1 Tax=Orrella sp. 11846 TaxID=3409913 RepID=UPI003B5AF810